MKKKSLYIHIPFCKQKCFYCDFSSFPRQEKFMLSYTKALCKEILKYKDVEFSTIFIGGGTPTYLSLDALNILKETMALMKLEKLEEFTVEGNPGTFSKEKLEIFKAMGVNRLSIGLQAVQDNLLKKIGRIHSFKDFLESYNLARELGFCNINIDLMFGLPGQSLEAWKETLDTIIKLNPEHLSCYSLIVEEGTKFYKLYEEDKLSLPSEEIEREMYSYAKVFFESHGYKQYEISNYSKDNRECQHNLVYWNLEDYIGCGLGAHSFNDEKRFYNSTNLREYISLMEDKDSARVDTHENTLEDDMEEFMFLGLRKIEGISFNRFKELFKEDIYEVYGEIINKYVSMELLKIKEDRLFLSEKGIEVSNMVMADFIIDR